MTDAASAIAFLKALFRGVEGDVYLCSLPNTHGARPGEQALRSRDPRAMRQFIERWDKPGRALYFCISTLKPDATPTKRGSYRSKANCWRLPALPLDVDFDKLPEMLNKQAAAIGMLERSAVPPQLTVLSGGGVHAYWIMEQPFEPGGFTNAETLLRGLIKRFRSDAAVCDVSRLMRLPGSTNSKRGDERAVILAKNASDGRIDLLDLQELLREPPAAWPAEGQAAAQPRAQAHYTPPGNAFEAYGADAWKAPIDVEAALNAMHYPGNVHQTQLSCMASLLNAGKSIEEAAGIVLMATGKVAQADWNMQREKENLIGMGQTWLDKRAADPPKPNGHDNTNVVAFPSPASGNPAPEATTPQEAKETPPASLASRLASSILGTPAPERFFLVDSLVPCRDVTLLYGDGGTGKSLLVLQLAIAMQNRQNMLWLGLTVSGGRCLVYTAEEEYDELHRRLEAIVRHAEIAPEELIDLHLVSLAGEDATLAWAGPNQQLAPTPRFKALEASIADIEPALVIIDTAADTFGGNENDRRQVGQFIRMLRGLAIKHDTTILLLAQPSRAGIRDGDGMSGSTAWNNSARSRLYLERVLNDDKEEPDADVRTLRSMKANYAQKGFELQLQWQDGIFVPLLAPGESGLSQVAARDFAEHKFLALLAIYNRENRPVSPNKSSAYAPAVFAADQRADRVSRTRFAHAMNQLLQDHKIKTIIEGPPSKQRHRLVIA